MNLHVHWVIFLRWFVMGGNAESKSHIINLAKLNQKRNINSQPAESKNKLSNSGPPKKPSAAYALVHDIFSNYDKRVRPVKGNKTLEVTINMRLNQLLSLVKFF